MLPEKNTDTGSKDDKSIDMNTDVTDNSTDTGTNQALSYDQQVLVDANTKLKADQKLLKNQLDKAKKSLASSTPSTEVERMQQEIEQLSELKKQVEAKAEEEELAKKKNDLEREKYLHEKELTKLQTEITTLRGSLQTAQEEQKNHAEQYQSELATLRSIQLENDIFSASKELAYNPKQIVLLLKSDFTYDNELHQYVHPVTNDKGKVVDEVSVAEHVKTFLAKEENDNLALAPAKASGSGTPSASPVTSSSSSSTTNSNSNSPFAKSDSQSKQAKLKREANLRDFTVDEWVELKKLKADIVAKKKKERAER